MNKVVFVKAHFKPVGKYEIVQVPTGEKGFLGVPKTREEKKWVQTGYSDCKIDGERLTQDIQQVIDKLNGDGYEVVSTVPVISGDHQHETFAGVMAIAPSGGYGYGFSYTEGVIIIARKTSS